MATGQRDGSLPRFYSLTYLKSVCSRSLWLKFYQPCTSWGKNLPTIFSKLSNFSSFCTFFVKKNLVLSPSFLYPWAKLLINREEIDCHHHHHRSCLRETKSKYQYIDVVFPFPAPQNYIRTIYASLFQLNPQSQASH